MRFKLTLAIIASFVAAPAVAADSTPARGVYAGVFGGGGGSSATDVTQFGTVFFTEAEGGPLAVNATGKTDSGGVGFVGGQVGYEFSRGSAALPSLVLPAFEIEGFYLDTGTRNATLQNPGDRLPEHTFDDTLPMNSAVLLANMVLSFPTAYPGVTPYIGGGIGGALVKVDGANSLQTNPAEDDINHFSSASDSSAWTFAAQAKAGVRIALGSNAYLFGEYRYLYVGSTDLTFGSTVYPNHAATSPWTVRLDETSYHLATAGIGFGF
jgi:opacity protein-like surface antigen